MAAVRQNEMKVNITLVTTSTWLVDGPRRRGRSGVLSPEGMAGGVPGMVERGDNSSAARRRVSAYWPTLLEITERILGF